MDIDFDKVVKRYKRFLKENGIYRRAIEIHMEKNHIYHPFSQKYKNLSEALNGIAYYDWMQSTKSFCMWASTKEGDAFWWFYSILWRYICFNEYHIMSLSTLICDINTYLNSNIYNKRYPENVNILEKLKKTIFKKHEENNTISN